MTHRFDREHLWTCDWVGVTAVALAAFAPPAASAGELVYHPVNPSFGGSPFNAAFLLGTAQAQDRHKDPDRRQQNDDPAAQFARTLQSRLLGGLADQVTHALFGENARDSGRIVFGDLTIDFNRGAESIRIEIIDAAKGSSTVIEVPNVPVESAG